MFELDKNARDAGVTVVENLFIREYLPAAKGDYVKVYLYGLHLCQYPQQDYGAAEMAKDLELSRAEVESALRYWERRSLVTKVSDDPEVYRFYSPMQRMHAGVLTTTQDSEYTLFAESVYTAFGEKRKVKPAEIARMWEWVQDIGLPPEVVLMLLNHMIALMRTHFSMKQAENMAVLMKENKVFTVEDAELFLRNDMEIHKGAQDVLRHFGKRSRLPSEAELKLYRKWRMEWLFDHNAILSACQETAKGEPTFAYLDGILRGISARSESRTGAQVEQLLSREQDENDMAKAVMDQLGLKMTLTQALNFYRQWRRHMPHDVVMMAASLCARRKDKMGSMDQLLSSWQEKGLTDIDAATRYTQRLRRIDPHLRTLFEILAYQSVITEEDRALFEKWQAFGYDMPILEAAARQTHGVEGNKLRYMDSVICAWHDAGITDASQIQLLKKSPQKDGPKQVRAQQYTQRQYTDADLAFGDSDLMKEAAKQHG